MCYNDWNQRKIREGTVISALKLSIPCSSRSNKYKLWAVFLETSVDVLFLLFYLSQTTGTGFTGLYDKALAENVIVTGKSTEEKFNNAKRTFSLTEQSLYYDVDTMNVTEDLNHTTNQEFYCTTGLNKLYLKIIISVLNVSLSITAFLGNVLIIVALQKASSLHPPSKLLFSCLASTDLCVGLIAQPLYVFSIMSPEHSQRCLYLGILLNSMGVIFCGVSLLTLTAISVDRLLALLLGLRYRQVVTVKKVWVFIVVSWLFSMGNAVLSLYSFLIAASTACILLIFYAATSMFCYTKIYLTLRHHQATVQDHVHQREPNGQGVPLNISRYRRTVSNALRVLITLVACYFPCGILVPIFSIITTPMLSLDIAWSISLTLLFLNSTLNPFLYYWKMREMKQAVMDTTRQLCCSWN